MFELTSLFGFALAYLLLLFGTAFAADRGWVPERIVRSTITRTLAVGVFAGSVAFFASMNLATSYGAGYLLYFIGGSAAFLIAPVFFNPLWRIAQRHNLGSLADVFAFRYPGEWVGAVVTVFMLLGVLPLIALQIQAAAATIHMLNQDLSQEAFAITFCTMLTVFAILFGARNLSMRYQHDGLVVAVAFESLVKLIAMLTLAGFAVYSVFGGLTQLNVWLEHQSAPLEEALSEGASRTLLLLFFAGVVAMPHVYHMLFTENDDPRVLAGLRWGVPLFLLIMSAAIAPIVWAADYAGFTTDPEYYLLGMGIHLGSPALTILAFIGGLAAASGVLIVSTLALSSMTLNHVILPFIRPPGRDSRIVSRLLIGRHVLIGGIILAAYGLYRLFNVEQNLISLALMAFVATLQFLPGLVGAFLWPRATRRGFIAGLVAGFTVWFLTLMMPLIYDIVIAKFTLSIPLPYELAKSSWDNAAKLSLAVNSIVFIVFSLASRQSREEANAAAECMSNSITRNFRGELVASSVRELQEKLATAIGPSGAEYAVNRALRDLALREDETRPDALRQIRDQMETNLSGILGQTIAHRVVSRFVPYKNRAARGEPERVPLIENRLEDYQTRLTGLAAELDKLRRYHRQILLDLPSATSSIDRDGIVILWNRAMEEVTGLPATRAVGSPVAALPQPWCELFATFIDSDRTDQFRVEVEADGARRMVNLHKASVDQGTDRDAQDLVLVIDDITEGKRMEDQLLHTERLAAIGELAAGVAHEIGNPITGIACLAQNLKFEAENDEQSELASDILTQTERVSTILQALINFAHRGRSDATRVVMPVGIRQCVDESIALVSLADKNAGVAFRNACADDAIIEGDPQRLAQVFVNLLTNAREASGPGSDVRVSAVVEGNEVVCRVEDTGTGIPGDALTKVFDPFFTTKGPGEGTGMGLAIVTTIVAEHDGSISADSPPPKQPRGTCVTLRFPCAGDLTSVNDVVLTSTRPSVAR